jgi:hypothetical protein
VALAATSTDGTVNCSGSASFSVTARATTNVTVFLQCNTAVPESGSAAINGRTYDCATIRGVSVSPSETAVGTSLGLSATAVGVDPGSLVYAWSAPSGTFSAPTAADTNFTCTQAGTVAITLKVSDGPVPDGGSCNAATSTATVQVICTAPADGGADASPDGGATACSLGRNGAIKHVIYIQFDNTHLVRDRAAVPSDLEQMPHLLNFIRGNGTMMANDHTVLISHTAGGILSSLTGLYPDRHGQTVSNSYVRTSSTGTFQFPSSFGYWTDPASATTAAFNMVGPDGSNVPAPWVQYTRAGCDVGAIASANIVLENTGTGPSGDVTKVFGSGSPQFVEATNSAAAASGTAARQLAQTDLVGFAVHCALGSSLCASGEADLLPQEPGGYTGFKGLFGAQQIDPLLTGQPPSVALTDLSGSPIVDPFNQPGFPGFDGMSAAVSLAYVAAMQEHGIPITYAYISDAHDFHGVSGNQHTAFGPGSAGYVQQLASYDAAFSAFFTRLAADGIDKTNTLFVFTVDEGDHFVGGSPTPANCDGVNVACDWTNQVGELNANIDTLVSNQFPTVASKFLGASAPNAFTVHGDDAPTFYLAKKGDAGGPLAQTDPDTRDFERQIANLTAQNQYTLQTDRLLVKMADQTGMRAFHMITTGDPVRNPTFVFFADANYFLTDFPTSTCLTCINPAFAWNHGDIQPEIAQTWLGFVGPGVKNQPDVTVFSDHADVRPTINLVLGLHDSYASDGRAITQALDPVALPSALAANTSTVEALGAAYKQINAPFGQFAAAMLTASTNALASDDATYTSVEAAIAGLVDRRDTLATPIRTALDAAEFGNQPIDSTQAQSWITQANTLLSDAAALAASSSPADAGAPDATTPDADAGTSTDAAADSSSADATSDVTTPPDGGANGNVEVYRVGDGASSLANTGNAVFVDEFTPAGVLVRTISLPTALNGANRRLIASGTATSEGLLTRSADGRYLILTGYDSALGGAASVVTTTAASVARVVGRIDASGSVDTTTALGDAADGNNPRSASSTNGSDLWFTGAAGGIRYTTLGSTTSTQLSTTVVNLRQGNIFAGQLFVSTSSGSAVRLGSVGTGTPTTAGQTITNLPGFPTAGSPYAFFFADLDGTPGLDTVYVASDDASALTKFSLVAGSWVASGTVGVTADAYRGVTGVVSGSSVTLYATRKGGSGATGGGELVALVDASGYQGSLAGTPTLLVTAAANTAFRGVALAPVP